MGYKIYGDGEIWKNGKIYAKIYSDGEIWKDGRLYAKMYSDGEIWKDNRKVGRVYDDGQVYIDNQLWGKIYSNNSSSSSKKENGYTENKGFSFGVPPSSQSSSGFDEMGLPGFGIFVILFIVLLIGCTIAAFFMGGFELWRTFTIDVMSYGFMGIIASLLLVAGTIFGVITQINKFKGGFWLGLVLNTIIVIVTAIIGEFLVFGSFSFESLNTDIFTFVGTFAFMAAFPTAIGKLLSMLFVKLNISPKKSLNYKTQFNTTYKSNTSTKYRKTFKKSKRKQSILDIFEDFFDDLKYKTINIPNIVWYILIVILFCISWGFAFKYSGYFFWLFDVNVGATISLVLFVLLIYVHKKVFDGEFIKGLMIFAITLLVIQLMSGFAMGDPLYGFMETIDVLGFVSFIGYFIGATFGLSSIAYIITNYIE